jgi:hypothetical protein
MIWAQGVPPENPIFRKNARIVQALFDEIKSPLPPTKLLVFGEASGVIGPLLAELKERGESRYSR